MPAIGSGTGKSVNAPRKRVVGKVKPPSPTKAARAQEQQYASQGKAVERVANTQRATAPARAQEQAYKSQGQSVQRQANTQKAKVKGKVKHGGPLAAVVNLAPAALGAAETAVKVGKAGLKLQHDPGTMLKAVKNAPADAAELVVTTPSSVAKLASTAVHDPLKVPGMLAEPYKQLLKDPGKFTVEHPVTTFAMVAPGVRMPGRVIGKAARIAGKQTLERPAATLPGTALKDARTGSRDYFARAYQGRKDAKKPAPTVTVKDIQRRVDEHFDHGKHIARRTEALAVRDAHKSLKGLPRAQRKQARPHVVAHARETAREQAQAEADARFAQEFGATGRLSTGAAERGAAKTVRVSANAQLDQARAAATAAGVAHETALASARTARGRVQRSSTLSALEAQRRTAARGLVQVRRDQSAADRAHTAAVTSARVAAAKPTRTPKLTALEANRRTLVSELNAATKAHSDAMAGFGVARGRAEVLSRNVAGDVGERRALARTVPAGAKPGQGVGAQYAGGGHGVKVSAEGLQAATSRVTEARAAVERVDKALAAERKRVQGVPPAQHDALLRAMDAREQVPVRVRGARGRVRQLDQQIAAERARITGIPPAEHQALLGAIHGRAEARTALGEARTAADAAKTQHITTKVAMRDSTIVDPASEGRLFEHQADARLVARKLNETATPIATGGRSPVRLVVHEPGATKRPISVARSTNTEPLVFTVRQVGDKYSVVPKVARDRMYPSGEAGAKLSHQSVGTSPSTMAKFMRRSRGAFTQAVLPFSLKWLGGQASEASVRALIAGAGPLDWLRMGKVVKKMNADRPGSGDEYMMRMTGGQFDLTGAARDFAEGKSLAHEFQGTALSQPAAAATMAGHVLPVRAVRAAFRGYSRAVIGTVNGAIEHNARKAMAGQAIKNSPLIEDHILGLMDSAITDAANGLKATHAQIDTARSVNKMYGKYSKFSPEMRSLLLHWTPFLPWFINSAYFLAVHLPKDHPVQTALLADINAATEDWRKSHDLSLRQPNHVPLWMMGDYPKKGGGYYHLGHYFPTGAAAQIASSTGGLVLPQMIGPIENLKGIDWKGKRLVDSHGNEFTQGQDALRALVTAVEGQVPGAKQVGALTGVTPRYVDRTDPAKIPGPKAVLKKMLPTAPIGGGAAPVSSGSSSSGRIKVPGGVTGRVKVPGGVTGRVKVPGG